MVTILETNKNNFIVKLSQEILKIIEFRALQVQGGSFCYIMKWELQSQRGYTPKNPVLWHPIWVSISRGRLQQTSLGQRDRNQS